MVNTKVCHTVSYLVPSQWNVVVRIFLALVTLLLNIFIISIFLRRQNRTPVTILLSFLAITDSLTSLFAVIPNFSGQYLFSDELRYVKNGIAHESGFIWNRRFPHCAVFNILDDLSYAFHMMSVLVTTLLCIQKTVVIRFPLWGKTHLTTKTSIISALVVVICALVLFIPTTILGTSEMFKGDNGSCCYSERHIFVTLQAEHYLHDDTCTGVLNNSNVVEIGTYFTSNNTIMSAADVLFTRPKTTTTLPIKNLREYHLSPGLFVGR